MADIYWPETLPNGLLAEGFSKRPQSNVIRTRMDAGPSKARRRYTARAVNFNGKQIFDKQELFVFENFYRTELADGALRFMFEDSITGDIGEFRFTADYDVVSIEGLYEVQMSLELLS
jgi:hypothetical protein